MKKLILAGVLAALWANLSAQIPDIRPLKIGDQVPDITLNKVLNYKTRMLRLTDFRGKNLIIDFGATNCSPCIRMIPLLDSLQEENSDRLQILPVTYESEKAITNFNRQYATEHGRASRLPNVVENRILRQYFPHRYIPHYVWIDREGKVSNITSDTYVTRERVRSWLDSGNMEAIPQKTDLDLTRPLYTGETLPMDRVTDYHLVVKGWIEGAGSSYHLRNHAEATGFCRTNHSLVHLYQAIFSKMLPDFCLKQLAISAADSAALVYSTASGLSKKDWYHRQAYSIDCIVPRGDSAGLNSIALADLNRATPFRATIVQQKVKHLEFTIADSEKMPKSGPGYENTLGNAIPGRLKEAPASHFVMWYNETFPGWPLMVFKGDRQVRIGIELNSKITSLEQLIRLLEQQGYRLKYSREPVTMVSVTSKTVKPKL